MIEYKKKSYAMKAEVVAIGTEIYNFLEDCHYTTNEAKCVKLIGTVGEEWPVTLEKLAKTYTLADGTHITQENIPAGVFDIVTIVDDSAETIFAEQTIEQTKVSTSWGEVLTANPDDSWVVNGMVFNNTYAPVNS